MKKKILGILLASILTVTSVFSGCAQKASQSGPITINMYHSWSNDTARGKALDDLVNKFNQENQGKIKVVVTINPDFPTYQSKVKTMMAANQTPDVFHYNFNSNDLSRQKSGKLMNFSPYMDSTWKARFNANDLKTLTVDGQLTSIPFEKAGALFYYNKTLFTKAGISSFPTTWDDFFADCKKLKDAGVAPISLFTSDDAWYTFNLYTYFAASLGGDSAFQGSLDNSSMEKAAEYLKQAFGYTTDDAIGANYAVASSNFSSGKTAMLIDGPWLIGSLDPSFVNNVGVASAPTFGDNKVQYGYDVTDAQTPWAAGKQTNTAKAKAIVDFLKFITSEDSTEYLTIHGQIALSAKLTLSQSQKQSAGVLMTQYIQVASKASQSFVNVQRNLTTSADTALPSLLESMALGKITPQDFVKQLNQANN